MGTANVDKNLHPVSRIPHLERALTADEWVASAAALRIRGAEACTYNSHDANSKVAFAQLPVAVPVLSNATWTFESSTTCTKIKAKPTYLTTDLAHLERPPAGPKAQRPVRSDGKRPRLRALVRVRGREHDGGVRPAARAEVREAHERDRRPRDGGGQRVARLREGEQRPGARGDDGGGPGGGDGDSLGRA